MKMLFSREFDCLISPCRVHNSILQPGAAFLRKIAYLCALKFKKEMKKGIHPENYRTVVFKDFSCDEAFLSKSCAPAKDTIVWEDGKEYPLIKLEISNKSHHFFTGKMKFVDTAGRIDKFNRKFAKFNKAKESSEEK